ncbi:MAG: hypothetical protein U0931_37230 [Vulcanimicrobiota bacterium]
MRRRHFLEVIGVASLAAVLARHDTKNQVPASLPELERRGYSVDGVRPGMPRAQVEGRLGRPDYEGKLAVRNNQTGTYVEYGNSRATWNGSPTIVYDQDGRVISVVGTRLLNAKDSVFRLGDDRLECLARVGRGGRRNQLPQETVLVELEGQRLTLTFERDRLTRMVLS